MNDTLIKGAKLDYLKYGFRLKSETNGLYTYVLEANGEVVELSVLINVHTLRIAGNRDIMVANRYIIDTQEQLDWFIFNGRAGILFMPFSGSNHVS